MNEDSKLKQAAMEALQSASEEHLNIMASVGTSQPATNPAPESLLDDDEEDAVVDYGFYDGEMPVSDAPEVKLEDGDSLKMPTSDSAAHTNIDEITKAEMPESVTAKMTLDESDLKAYVPTGKEEGFENYAGPLALELNQYAKELVTEYGLDPKEALQARDAKAKARIVEEREKFLKGNPNVGVIRIREGDEKNLGLTNEEHNKLSRVKEIKLIEVEDQTLKTIPILAVDPSNKREMLDKVNGVFCEDKTPLPSTCDYASFRGLQVFELLQAYVKPDDLYEDVISRKAQVLYESFQGSTRLKKYDENRNVILSYDDFIKNYSFFDLNFGLFSVICASSKDETEGEVRCPRCQRFTRVKYNVRKIMKLDNLPDTWKERIDNILENRTDLEKLDALRGKLWTGIRMESPVTKFIYDIKIPSISKALNVAHFINKDASDEDLQFFTKAMFVNSMYVLDRNTNQYIPINPEEQALLLDWFRKVPQDDVDAIDILSQKCQYYPRFEHELQCSIDDKCHYKWNNTFDVEGLVFLRGHDTPVVTAY